LVGCIAIGTFAFSIVSTLVPYFNPFAMTGMLCLLASMILFYMMQIDFSIAAIIGYQILAGMGLGMSWLAEIIFPRAALTKHQLAKALGYSRMLQQLGS
jgi:hypothetical protein